MAMQQSEERATRNGITALETASSAVLRCQQDVQTTADSLTTAYQGTDGGKFQDLLAEWGRLVNIIRDNMEHMIEELNNTLRDNQLMQASATDAIDQQVSRAPSVFDALSGSKTSA